MRNLAKVGIGCLAAIILCVVGLVVVVRLLLGMVPEAYTVDLGALILENGGYAAMKAEVEEVANTLNEDNPSTEYFPTNLPPVLASLEPQAISIHWEDPLMINIQICGGFYHRGLIVDPSEKPVSMDEVGMNWLRGELAPGVFEYRE